MVWKAAVASLDRFLQSSHSPQRDCMGLRCLGTVLLNNLVSIVVVLDGQVIRLQYSINIVVHGDSALPLVGEIQQHTQILVGFTPVDFQLP
jgi:hypothetical protein